MGSDDSDAGALSELEEESDSDHSWVNDRSNTSFSSESESVGQQQKKRRRLLPKTLDPNVQVTVGPFDGVEPITADVPGEPVTTDVRGELVTADVPSEQVVTDFPSEQVATEVPGEFRCIAILVIFAIVGSHYYNH